MKVIETNRMVNGVPARLRNPTTGKHFNAGEPIELDSLDFESQQYLLRALQQRDAAEYVENTVTQQGE